MNLASEDLAREASATGFSSEPLEKVLRLMSLLDALNSHPFLKTRIVLKGGTALNLFHFALPRLSVDIDLNYIGAADRETIQAERLKVDQAVQAVCSREGLAIKRMPDEHAGGKWRLSYQASSGSSGNLELDVNFMLRTPLWSPRNATCCPVGSFGSRPVPILDIHELAAGKLAALLSRNASRDLFDSHLLLSSSDLDQARLRLGFVIYGGINRKDWRTVSPIDVVVDPAEAQRSLIPMLRAELAPSRKDVANWAEKLASECKERLAMVLPLAAHEREFLDHLNDRGEIIPELLTDNVEMHAVIRSHPGLQWKALNVTKHFGR